MADKPPPYSVAGPRKPRRRGALFRIYDWARKWPKRTVVNAPSGRFYLTLHGNIQRRAHITPSQFRTLHCCAAHRGWISLAELDQLLLPDDVLTVPSLVERALLEHKVHFQTVRITATGRTACATMTS